MLIAYIVSVLICGVFYCALTGLLIKDEEDRKKRLGTAYYPELNYSLLIVFGVFTLLPVINLVTTLIGIAALAVLAVERILTKWDRPVVPK